MRSRSACHFGGGEGFPETSGAAVFACPDAMRDVRRCAAFFASSRHARTHFFSRNEEGSDAFSIRAATPVMTRGSLGGAFAREKRSRSVDVLRNGARAVGEATRPSPEAAVAPVLVGKTHPTRARVGRDEPRFQESRAWTEIDRSFFRFRAEIFFDVRAVWKFRRSGPRTRRWVWNEKKIRNLDRQS
jgi:hypothetical protein